MKKNRRDFLKITGMAGLTIAGSGMVHGISIPSANPVDLSSPPMNLPPEELNLIGPYGQWAASLSKGKLPSLSFRNKEFTNIEDWRKAAKKKVLERLAMPDIGGTPTVTVKKQYTYDGLSIEELTWQLPYGRPTEAIVLKPANAKGPLPGILAFHDHGANKYFGTRKITRTGDTQHPLMDFHQQRILQQQGMGQ